MDVGLISEAKRKLNITWDDAGTDARVGDALEYVVPAVARTVALKPGDPALTEDAETRSLVINACFYEFSHQLDEFWRNYADDIQRCRIKHEVEAYRAQQTEVPETQ